VYGPVDMISVEYQGPVAVMRLEHGKVNALDVELLAALVSQLAEVERSPARAVVLTGAGSAFSAGVDLFRMLDDGPEYAERLIPALADAFEALFRHPKPVVAAVNGPAIAGGCVLACACDRRVLAEGARIGATELLVGVPFPVSALEIIRHACGDATTEVVLTGRLYDGSEALAAGLADEVVAANALVGRALEVAGALARIPADAFRLAKEQLRRPALLRMAADAPGADAEARRIWASPETAATVRASLDRLVRRKS
jgi:enoyl-CoA hydratase